MSDTKAQIASIKSDILRTKDFINAKKKSIQAIKYDKTRLVDRYRDQIKRADKASKIRLRDKKKYEMEGLSRQIDSLKKMIDDYKRQITKRKEEIKRIKK